MATAMLRAGIAQIPFEDHHVHQPYKRPHAIDLAEFRRPFTEAAIPAVWEDQLGSLVGYRWMVRELARVLGVAPDEAAVLAARNALAPERYHRLLADRANLGASYADDLFAFGQCYDVAEWADLLGRPVYRVLRIETFVEHGYRDCPTLEAALARLTGEIASAPARRIVSLKSIAAYRCGLAFAPPSTAQRERATAAYARAREGALAGDAAVARLADKDLVDTIVWTALEAAAPLRLPMQFHVAFGDDDIVMTKNDPTLMRALFTHEPFRVVPLVLLHCYPYQQQAGYLASIYPNVYVDLSLTIPIAGPGSARILAEALDLAPVAQVLASTDGHMTPEFQWFGVFVWRWALTQVLGQYCDWDVMDEPEALTVAAAILRDNARRIYPLPHQAQSHRPA